ncbi:DUF3948 family protein [Bacillus sp. R86525]
MNNITFNKLDFLGLASGSVLLTACKSPIGSTNNQWG